MKKKFLGICLAICLCYSQSFAFFDTIGAVGQAAVAQLLAAQSWECQWLVSRVLSIVA
ncbi:hypothetical protein [Candidatus Endomicrobiellum devescovinae]|jgi:hypothetical protein|uniref:hypothetical protein n=1 Tax=Candidatus Endomicrobiellum devescovinae TaxID=3242322 RepID=UPI00282AC91E|nr:hypothetical protein [Endomicrobium sp.]MDR2427788.1 hypothetical protein [Endomicrobium sp.]